MLTNIYVIGTLSGVVGIFFGFLFSHYVVNPIPFLQKKSKLELKKLKLEVKEVGDMLKNEAKDAVDSITIDDVIKEAIEDAIQKVKKRKDEIKKKLSV